EGGAMDGQSGAVQGTPERAARAQGAEGIERALARAAALAEAGDQAGALNLYLEVLARTPPDDPRDYEAPAMLLESAERFEEALSVCEQALRRLDGYAGGDPDLDRAEAQFKQRRLRLLRKLRRPVWSSQGTPW
ncbi:MAG TPA: hypothetical protein VHN78_16820, partial [Chloroflexota bacterium]|nr:hypothetical protein [Chloroflexota bacterium]